MKITLPGFSDQCRLPKPPQKGTILLVDDDQPYRTCLKDFLEIHGYACHEASNGIQALKVLKDHAVDLIITDNHMPQLGGLEFIEHIHQNLHGDPLPVFLMTAELNHAIRLRAFKQGVNKVFEKPLDLLELGQAVDWATKFGHTVPLAPTTP
jgi:CheY-like chemotaxis protein